LAPSNALILLRYFKPWRPRQRTLRKASISEVFDIYGFGS
jgi:hypothetical protein